MMIILNEINLSYLSPNYPFKDGLITTADEHSYFFPAESFYQSGNWNASGDGSTAYLRTPGYGCIYFIALLISNSKAFFVLKIIQIGFFSGSILIVFKILSDFLAIRYALIATVIFGLLPSFHGFTYYTLSEAVIPFFMLWWMYVLLKPSKYDFIMLFSSTAALVMIRPHLLVFPLVFALFYLIKKNKRSIYILVGLIPFLFWQIRTATILGEWPGIHPVYSLSNNSIYRPPHQQLTELFKIWEHESDVFHKNMGILSSDTSQNARNKVASTLPSHIQADVLPIFKGFQELRFLQNKSYAGKKLHDYLPGEEDLTQKIEQLTERLKSENKLLYHFITPAKSLKKLLVTSMMNLNVFQDAWRDNALVIVLKIVCFVLILFGFITALVFCFLTKITGEIKMLALSVTLSIFYLAYFQRLNEERYIYPYLSICFMFLCLAFMKTKTFIQKKSRPIETTSAKT
jgi:hypothetical protein